MQDKAEALTEKPYAVRLYAACGPPWQRWESATADSRAGSGVVQPRFIGFSSLKHLDNHQCIHKSTVLSKKNTLAIH